MVKRGIERRTEELMELLRPYTSGHRAQRVKLIPSNSALLVIDMQRYFLDKTSHACVPCSKDVLANVEALIESYRRLSLPVIFTRYAVLRGEDPGAMARWWGDVLQDDDEMSDIVPSLAPQQGDIVLRKSQYSAFIGTDLEKIIRKKGITNVVVTGVLTHLCCESTARDAFMRGLDVFVVVDGMASDHEDLHASALKTLADCFAIPMTTAEVVGRLKRK